MTATQTKTPIDIAPVHPYTEHNQRWVGHVHPGDWTNPTPTRRYNLLVIGGGPAGLVVAAGAAGLGAKVALVERHLLGGDCLNVGCVPSKAILRCAHMAGAARHADAYHVRVPGEVTVDFPAVMERMRKLRADLSHHDSAERFAGLGVDVFIGEGSFTGPDAFEIDGKKIEFARACVATGARAIDLPIPGLVEAAALTNESVFSLTALPGRLAVVGAGPIGVELAQAFAQFGSDVTLLEVEGQILMREDRDAADIIDLALRRDGVTINCCAQITQAHRDGDETVLVLDSKDKPGLAGELRVDEVLVGVGRAPNVEGMNLEGAGVDYDTRAGIKVNDFLQTSNPRIYAAGDVASVYKFTHNADAMARIVIQNALFSFGPLGKAKTSTLNMPWCTYTDPEIAHVGKYAHELEAAGVEHATVKINMNQVDRAVLDGETEGFLKVHYEPKKGLIFGATLVAKRAGDMISELSVAMAAGAGLGTIAATIHPYPTQAEIIKKAGDEYKRTKLTPGVAKLFERILRWRR